MTKHESSNNHISACLIYNKWNSDQVLDTDLDKTLKFKNNYWIKVLERVINVTLTLAKNNVSFRGDNESLYHGDHNRGNFLNIIELLSIYDPVLKELLSKDKKCVKYLSPTIQNEIINLLANEVKTELISQINESPFFSVIMDTTQDISKIDQVSFVVRYADFIKDNDNVIRDVVIREVFLGFEKCMGQSAEDMVKQLLLFFEKNNLSFERLRTQGYDGAANMTGVYNGLQAKILEKQPNALYVYCAAHNLNLVINDSHKTMGSIDGNVRIQEAHIKTICPTRWLSRYDSLHSLRFHYREILQVLTKLTLTSSKTTEQNEALGLKKKLENFETVVLIVIEHKILSITKLVSNALQSKNQDIQRASKLLETAKKDIAEMRNSFEEVINEAADLARGWEINPSFKEHRIRKVKKQFDELSCDERLFNAKKLPCVGV
ncbi:zinc finger MYM-type protein 1-like [Sitophilus oryzae]|uniref:Zinc finger MYM-type protein 1-like n=1 Tax=Sitophilus oryzae TaxID=7048 RepID=A0A6J2XJG2_SITOR|nr:zinc finger MYM-type protein 1-like [Sitophilus oryzae]